MSTLDEPRQTLQLIGQYDSPFVRRVAIALLRYDMPYQHVPWSVWGDADALSRQNPLRRVPVLVLEDGTPLADSFAIVDYLDEKAGAEKAMLPPSGVARRNALQVIGLALGMADKAVALFYELLLHEPSARSQKWAERCTAQIRDTLALLDEERAKRRSSYWFGEELGHADVAVACALRFTREVHPDLARAAIGPALEQHAARCEALPEFQRVVKPFSV